MAAYGSELSRLVDELNRSTAAARTGEGTSIDRLLALAVQRGASDVILVAGSGIALRVKGSLTQPGGKPLSSEELRSLLLPLLTARQAEELETNKSLDFCFVRGSIGRFRANFHFQRGTLAASIRLLPAQIPSLESLHLPLGLAQLAERRQGLVLLTGPTGCGKTSTLAALLDLINARRRDHIITIEDPVEYQHANRSSIVEQIEVGHDTPSFAEAVRAVLRQDDILAPTVRRLPGLRVAGAFDGFELAVRTVLGQQVSVKGASTIAGRWAQAFGEPVATPFPSLNRLSSKRKGGCGSRLVEPPCGLGARRRTP